MLVKQERHWAANRILKLSSKMKNPKIKIQNRCLFKFNLPRSCQGFFLYLKMYFPPVIVVNPLFNTFEIREKLWTQWSSQVSRKIFLVYQLKKPQNNSFPFLLSSSKPLSHTKESCNPLPCINVKCSITSQRC